MQRAASVLTSLFLVLVIAVGCFVNGRSIRAFPNFSATDEAIIFDYADTWKRTGSVEPSLMPYSSLIVNGNLYICAAALWTNLFPNDPLALRNLSALGGFILLVVVYFVTRQMGDYFTATIATALLATNLLWSAVSHVGRQDVWLTVFVWTAVGLSLVAQKRNSRGLALAAGLLIALSADVHPLGVLACIALGVWWLHTLKSNRNSRQTLSAFIVGGLFGMAYYLVVHVVPNPAAFVQAIHNELYSNGAEGGTPLGAMLQRHLNYFASNPLEVGLLIFCGIKAVRQHQKRGIGILIAVLSTLYAFLVADPNPYYPIVWFTGLIILSALTVRHFKPQWRVPLVLAFFAAFVINAARIEHHVSTDWNVRALDGIQQVAAHVPEGTRGVGENFLYIALRDNPHLQPTNYIGFTYVYFRALETGVSYWEIIETFKPDWIVTMRDESEFTPQYDTLSVTMPHMRLVIPAAALQQQYGLTHLIPTTVGTFEIWQRR
jgi:hypothetical protein